MVLKVMELTAPPPAKTGKKSVDNRKLSLASNSGRQMQQQATGPQRRYSQGMAPPAMMNISNNMSNNDSVNNMQARRKISLFHNMKFSAIAEEQQKAASLNPNAPVFMMQQRRMSRPSQTSGPPPGAFMMTSAQPISAWMNRRISGQLDYATSGLTLPPNVIRQPRGPPENGKGFQKWCRSRMEPVRKPSKAVPIVSPTEKAEAEPKKEEIAQDLAESGAVAAVEAVPVVAEVEPVMVVVDLADDESGVSSEDDDEGHFSDHDRLEPNFSFENERIR